MIIGGPSSQLLAARVAAFGDQLALCEYRTFPDGESYSQVLTELEDTITIIQSTPTDRDLVCLLQLLDICRDKTVSLVIPYFGYGRQDKIFKKGEPVTARACAAALNSLIGPKGRIFLVNTHAPSILSHFQCRAMNLDATSLLAERVRDMDLDHPLIISPDKGALAMAQTAAASLGAEYNCLEKTRLSDREVIMAPRYIDVAGRDVVIFDDMIATGGTMATAISMLRKQGAKRVFLAAVHPVLTGNALLKLSRAGATAILATDTLDRAVSVVSVAPLIAEALKS